jgi:hypothetical protein
MRQQAESAQQAAAVEQEAMQMQKMLDMAAVNQSTALAEERRARVLADIGLAKERESEVTQNHAKAFLDNAKTIAQIEDIPRKTIGRGTKARSRYSDAREAIGRSRIAEGHETGRSP